MFYVCVFVRLYYNVFSSGWHGLICDQRYLHIFIMLTSAFVRHVYNVSVQSAILNKFYKYAVY